MCVFVCVCAKERKSLWESKYVCKKRKREGGNKRWPEYVFVCVESESACKKDQGSLAVRACV